MVMGMKIRTATLDDLIAVSKIEEKCFPPLEAATEKDFEQRLRIYPNHFWVMEKDSNLIGFVNGALCIEKDLCDEMYADASYHDPNGKWQMIYGLDVIPEQQHKGYATQLMNHAIQESKNRGYNGMVLTCKDYMIPFYERFGFVNEGISKSIHGNVTWYQMRLQF